MHSTADKHNMREVPRAPHILLLTDPCYTLGRLHPEYLSNPPLSTLLLNTPQGLGCLLVVLPERTLDDMVRCW